MRVRTIFATLLAVAVASSARAQYLTPGAPSIVVFQPAAFHFGDAAIGPKSISAFYQYGISIIEDWQDNNVSATNVTEFDTMVSGSIPLLFFNSHGGGAIQCYTPDAIGLTACKAAYDSIVPNLYSGLDVVLGTATDPQTGNTIANVIDCKPSFVTGRYRGNRSIVWFGGCQGYDYAQAFRMPSTGRGAWAFLGYDYNVDNTVVRSDAVTAFARMSGLYGVSLRPFTSAVAGLAARSDVSSPDLVVAPRVAATSLAQDAHFDSARLLQFFFDAPMDVNQGMSYLVSTEGAVTFDEGSLSWDSGHTVLSGMIRGLAKGPGRVVLHAYNPDGGSLNGLRSDSFIGLDGNTDPPGSDVGGEEPGGDDFILRLYSDNADNPAAAISGFAAVKAPGGGVRVAWLAEMQAGTAAYLVERGAGARGPFALEGVVPASGREAYAVVVAGPQDGYWRLREVQTNGDTLVQALEQTSASFVISPMLSDTTSVGLFVGPRRSSEAVASQHDYAIVAPHAWITPAQQLATYWTNQGVVSTAIDLDVIGGPQGIKAALAAERPRLRYALLFADANDYADLNGTLLWPDLTKWTNGFTQPSWPSQPTLNVIPMHYTLDPDSQQVSLSYFTPWWGSDWDYVDFDGDGLPDISIGRVPVHNSTEATNYLLKALSAETIDPTSSYVNHVGWWEFGYDLAGKSGDLCVALAESLTLEVPASLTIDRIQDLQLAPLTIAQRNGLPTDALNQGRSLVCVMGTAGNRYVLACFMDLTRGFDFSTLANNYQRLPFLLGVNCGIANFDETENDSIGRPLMERFLIDPSRGFWGAFAPNRGSWQYSDYLIGQAFLRRVYQRGASSAGEAAMLAMREVAQKYPQYLDAARSFVFLGDPVVRLPFMRYTTGVQPGDAAAYTPLLSVVPTPSHGMASVWFRSPVEGRATLEVFDLQGRLVRTLVDAELRAGFHSVAWDGRGDEGRAVDNGIYFVRLRAGDRSMRARCVLIR